MTVHHEKITTAIVDGFQEIIGTDFPNIDLEEIRKEVGQGLLHATLKEIEDMEAFVDWFAGNKRRAGWVASSLFHDLQGLKFPDPAFSSRTAGYSNL